MHLALMLGDSEARGVPTEREHARGVVDRQSGEVDQLGTGDAFGEILVQQGRPIARQIEAGEAAKAPAVCALSAAGSRARIANGKSVFMNYLAAVVVLAAAAIFN